MCAFTWPMGLCDEARYPTKLLATALAALSAAAASSAWALTEMMFALVLTAATSWRSVTMPVGAGLIFGRALERTGSLVARTIIVFVGIFVLGKTTSAEAVSCGGLTEPNAAPMISPSPMAPPTTALFLRISSKARRKLIGC